MGYFGGVLRLKNVFIIFFLFFSVGKCSIFFLWKEKFGKLSRMLGKSKQMRRLRFLLRNQPIAYIAAIRPRPVFNVYDIAVGIATIIL